MNAETKVKADRYEEWRPALYAFIAKDSPWASQTLENLKRGDPLSDDNRRTIRALQAAFIVQAVNA